MLAPATNHATLSCMNNTHRPGGRAFALAATGLLAGAVVHVAAWLAGPHWVAALGAPPSIVASAAAGGWAAALGTLAIAGLLAGLALCCFTVTRRVRGRATQRVILALFAVIFLARGLLVLPFMLAGQREWHTPIGHFIVTGQWFAAGSLVVLAIGMLMVVGLWQSRSSHQNP